MPAIPKSSWAISASDAERLAAATPPDLILMDICLKGERDGIEAAKRLREDHDAPIIFVTGIENPEVLARTRRVPRSDLLHKPFTGDDLRRSLQSARRLIHRRN